MSGDNLENMLKLSRYISRALSKVTNLNIILTKWKVWLIVKHDRQRYNVIKHNKGGKKMISDNLYSLRKLHQLTQEEVSERVGVSRQALAKWESGETMPDIEKCVLLAELYNVTLDDLVNYTKDEIGLSVPPKGKHVFGVVTVGDKGQIVIPHKARKIFQVQSGDRFIVLGDEYQGIALIKESNFLNMINEVKKAGDQYE